jgi:predicted ATPase/DNA-binding SARP family transcriptional activator
MEFRILGPLEVLSDGRVLDPGGHKPRALLALLLLEANRVVSSDRLIEALWEAEPPETARKALQVYVAHLRKLLGRERLQTRAPGYLLRVEADELDLARFQRLREAGRPKDAISLWRGPPLAEFAYERFARAEISRLEELRVVCLEERIEQDLALGRHTELVGELEALVHEHPLRERLRMQLMLALYRSGRQVEALEAYQLARTALVEELGIEPARLLRELHQAVLNQDPSLDLPVEERPEPGLSPQQPAEPLVRELRKTVTALAVALEVSSGSGEALDLEALRGVTSRAFAEVAAAVERHGGTIDAVAGDAVAAVFGLPVVHEDDALRGVRAAAEAREALAGLASQLAAERSLELVFRIGVSTGEVIAGGELRATGEPLTLASRLAQAAMSGEIALDAGTQRLVQRPARRLASPMIGRERERRRLHDAFDQAVGDHSCQLFTVLGPAGVGKSRLAQEFVDDLAGRALVARGRCLPYGEGITFWPLLEAVRGAVGLDDSESPEEGRTRLVAALAGEQDAERAAQQVAELIGLADSGGGAEDGFRAVRTLLQALTRTQPLVLVFDDIHWGEATFLDLVEYVADAMRDAPIVVVCLARPELLDVRPGWAGGKLNATSVLLEPLSESECARLIENLIGQADLAGELESRIVEAAEGNPLFVEEMLSMLIDDGLLVPTNGGWAASGAISAVRVPPTIQALLAARLDRLDPDERAVIERAAVEGKVFHEGAVARLAPESLSPSVAMHLDTLVRKELVRPGRPEFAGERAFRFRHLLIRDAAYDSIPKAARIQLHEVFARWLEERTGDRTGYEEIIGYHLEQAYLYCTEVGAIDDAARALAREAADRLGSAGHRAFMRGDAAAAVNLISRAVPLLPTDDPSRIDLVPNVRVVQGLGGDLSWAERVLTEAVTTAAATDDPRLEAHALVQRAFLRLFTQSQVTPRELFGVAEAAISVFEKLGDQLGLARAWRLIAQAHYLARQAGPSAEASARALEHGRRAADRLELREIIEWLCVALMLGPTPAHEAAACCEELLADVERDPTLEPTVLSVLANVQAMQGHMKEAEALIARWRSAVGGLGESIWLSAVDFGFVAFVDDPAAAERELRPGYEALRRIGEKSHFSSVTGLLARAVCAQGRYDEADQLSRESERAARPNDIHSHILWRTARAKVLAHRGELEAGEALAREAVAFAAESDFLDSHGDALTDLAEVLCLAARRHEAASALAHAVQLYELKGNALSAERARARLNELA